MEQTRYMSTRGFVSFVLYHIGDYISDICYTHDLRYMWVYYLYQRIMLLSSNIDKYDEVWKTVDGQQIPKVSR